MQKRCTRKEQALGGEKWTDKNTKYIFFPLSFFNILSSFSYILIYNSYYPRYSTILFYLFNYNFIYLRLFLFSPSLFLLILNFSLSIFYLYPSLLFSLFFFFIILSFLAFQYFIFPPILPTLFYNFPLLLQSPPILRIILPSHSFDTLSRFLQLPLSNLPTPIFPPLI